MRPIDLIPDIRKWEHINLASFASYIKSSSAPQHWLTQIMGIYQGATLFGGYLENRKPLFDNRHDPEAIIHLGVDFWVPEGTNVFFPYPGEVMYAGPTDTVEGGWGGRVDIYSMGYVYIFGHLHTPMLARADKVVPDMAIGRVAPRAENGGWLPHLHLQVATIGYYSQFPNPRDMDAYARPSADLATNFMDPMLM